MHQSWRGGEWGPRWAVSPPVLSRAGGDRSWGHRMGPAAAASTRVLRVQWKGRSCCQTSEMGVGRAVGLRLEPGASCGLVSGPSVPLGRGRA